MFGRRYFGCSFFGPRYWGGVGAPSVVAPPPTHETDIRLYDADGGRMLDLAPWFDAIDFEYLERGGYGQGSISLLATWEDLQLTGNERLDVYLFGEFAYRGYIRISDNEVADPERCKPTLYGLMEQLGEWQVRRKYSYGCGADVGTIFNDIVTDYVAITGRKPSIAIDAQSIGVLVSTFDGRGKNVAQALNALCDLAPGQCMWGVDVDGSLNDRIYFRPKPTSTLYKPIVGGNVEAFTYPRDTAAIVNRIFIKGGPVLQPNLASNGNFDDPKPSAWDLNNRLVNPSFEDASAGLWTLGGGATIKTAGADATCHGAAKDGQKWLELDQTGENAYQTAKIDYTQEYTVGFWHRYEDAVASSGDLVDLVVQGKTSGGADVALAVATLSTVPDDTTDVYKFWSLDFDFSAYPTVTQVRITLTGSGGTASNDGNLIDGVGLWPKCSSGQSGWRMNLDGAANVSALDFLVKNPAPYAGGYCVKLKPQDIAISADVMEIYNPKAAYAKVLPNERYTLIVWVQTNSLGSASFSFGVAGYKSDGFTLSNIVDSNANSATTVESSTLTLNTSTWTKYEISIITGSDTAYLQIFLRARSNAAVYFSAVMLVEGETPQDVTDFGDYWPGETYEAEFDVEDTELTNDISYSTGLDEFTDTAGTSILAHTPDKGDSWQRLSGATLPLITAGNRLRPPGSSAQDVFYLAQGANGRDQDVYFEITCVSDLADSIQAYCFMSLDADNYHFAGGLARGAGAQWSLGVYSPTNPFGAQLGGSPLNFTPTVGHTYQCRLRVRDDRATLYVDGVAVLDAAYTNTIPCPGHFGLFTNGAASTDDTHGWQIDNYRATDNSEANPPDSITTYGEHENTLTNDQVTDHASAKALAISYFKAHAEPLVQASLTVRGPTALMKQDGLVKLLNLPDPPDPLFPSRIHYKIDGGSGIVMEAELGNERPELASLFAVTNARVAEGLL